MALVKCPKHKIPYNDANPRGCPACAQEKDAGAANVMQELARASQLRRTSGAVPAIDTDVPVTTQPRIPVPTARRLEQLLVVLKSRRTLAIGGGAIVLLLLILAFTSR